MTEVRIHFSANGPVTFATSDEATVAGIRAALDAIPDRHLVPVRDLAGILRANGRSMWASSLDSEEEASMVLVVFT